MTDKPKIQILDEDKSERRHSLTAEFEHNGKTHRKTHHFEHKQIRQDSHKKALKAWRDKIIEDTESKELKGETIT